MVIVGRRPADVRHVRMGAVHDRSARLWVMDRLWWDVGVHVTNGARALMPGVAGVSLLRRVIPSSIVAAIIILPGVHARRVVPRALEAAALGVEDFRCLKAPLLWVVFLVHLIDLSRVQHAHLGEFNINY